MVRAYLAPHVVFVDGPLTFWRSIMHEFIDVTAGETFDEMDHPLRHQSLVIVSASQAAHDAIIADGRAVPVGPICTSRDEFQQKLETTFASIPSATRQAAQNKMEALGINTAWVGGSNTIRDVLRYALRVIATCQRVNGEQLDATVGRLFTIDLDSPVSAMTQAQRNAVSNWMSDRGLATGWIQLTTPIREVVHFIITNLGIGTLKVFGEGF